jgi:hypothetical protein
VPAPSVTTIRVTQRNLGDPAPFPKIVQCVGSRRQETTGIQLRPPSSPAPPAQLQRAVGRGRATEALRGSLRMSEERRGPTGLPHWLQPAALAPRDSAAVLDATRRDLIRSAGKRGEEAAPAFVAGALLTRPQRARSTEWRGTDGERRITAVRAEARLFSCRRPRSHPASEGRGCVLRANAAH